MLEGVRPVSSKFHNAEILGRTPAISVPTTVVGNAVKPVAVQQPTAPLAANDAIQERVTEEEKQREVVVKIAVKERQRDAEEKKEDEEEYKRVNVPISPPAGIYGGAVPRLRAGMALLCFCACGWAVGIIRRCAYTKLRLRHRASACLREKHYAFLLVVTGYHRYRSVWEIVDEFPASRSLAGNARALLRVCACGLRGLSTPAAPLLSSSAVSSDERLRALCRYNAESLTIDGIIGIGLCGRSRVSPPISHACG